MLRTITRRILGSAAESIDRAATAAVVAHAQRAAKRSVRPASERITTLEQWAARFQDADLENFFAAPAAVNPGERQVRSWGNGRVSDLSWFSDFSPLDGEVRERYLSARENRVAVARRFSRGEGRPAVILIHGYMTGAFGLEERLWPLEQLAAAGLDIVLFTLPFHGERARAGYGAVPEVPGEDPRLNVEGFRQAIWDLQNLVGWLLSRGHSRVGVIGMSLGGYAAALLATVDARLDFVVPVIPLSSMADLAQEQGWLSALPEEAAREHALLTSIYRRVSPVVRPSVVPAGRCLVVGAKADRITPSSHARRLATHLRAPLHSFYGGHLLQLGRAEAFAHVYELVRVPRGCP